MKRPVSEHVWLAVLPLTTTATATTTETRVGSGKAAIAKSGAAPRPKSGTLSLSGRLRPITASNRAQKLAALERKLRREAAHPALTRPRLVRIQRIVREHLATLDRPEYVPKTRPKVRQKKPFSGARVGKPLK